MTTIEATIQGQTTDILLDPNTPYTYVWS